MPVRDPEAVFFFVFFFPTRGRKDFRSSLKACTQWVHLALDTNKAVQHVTFVSLNFQSFGGRHPGSDEIFRGCNNAAGWLAACCDPPWKTVRKAFGLGRVNDFCNIIITKVSGSRGSSSWSRLGLKAKRKPENDLRHRPLNDRRCQTSSVR